RPPRGSLMPPVVRRRAGAGAAGVFRTLLLLRTFALAATAALATATALSLARQRQPLQLAQVQPGQADGRLQVLGVLAGGGRVAAGLGLLGQQAVRLPRRLDLRLPHVTRLPFEP